MKRETCPAPAMIAWNSCFALACLPARRITDLSRLSGTTLAQSGCCLTGSKLGNSKVRKERAATGRTRVAISQLMLPKCFTLTAATVILMHHLILVSIIGVLMPFGQFCVLVGSFSTYLHVILQKGGVNQPRLQFAIAHDLYL